jgi:hypothetical protein
MGRADRSAAKGRCRDPNPNSALGGWVLWESPGMAIAYFFPETVLFRIDTLSLFVSYLCGLMQLHTQDEGCVTNLSWWLNTFRSLAALKTFGELGASVL